LTRPIVKVLHAGGSIVERRYDVVVVGGGTAGCVVAARASEDPRRDVLLVEQGPDPQPVPDIVSDPRRQAEVLLESPYVRMYEVERPIDGSTMTFLSGRILGGGSSVNNMSVIRPIRRDCEAWARFGGPAWSYEALLPVMRAIESDPDFADSPIHGADGPLHIERAFRLDMPASPPIRAFIETSVAFGFPECPDLNVPEPLGICASPYNIRDGRRQSTAVAWLDPARQRPNLTIAANTTATRLVLDGSRVTGIEVETATGIERIEAGHVVLAAGVYHSPQVLMLSGIGPRAGLEGHGVPVIHELPGVGEGYQDHAVVYMTWEGTSELREDYVIPKVRLIAQSDPSLTYGDLHVFVRPAIHMAGLPTMLPVSIHLLDDRGRGRVSLASADVHDLPHIEPGLLEHPDDLRAMTSAMRLVARMMDDERMRRYYGSLIQPGPGDDWETFARSTFANYHHGVGTCRMGPSSDRGAVVDERLRVHGLAGLSIADASVLPVLPHANTNVSAILAGEMAARYLD
jgi:choline dehydrogenase